MLQQGSRQITVVLNAWGAELATSIAVGSHPSRVHLQRSVLQRSVLQCVAVSYAVLQCSELAASVAVDPHASQIHLQQFVAVSRFAKKHMTATTRLVTAQL